MPIPPGMSALAYRKFLQEQEGLENSRNASGSAASMEQTTSRSGSEGQFEDVQFNSKSSKSSSHRVEINPEGNKKRKVHPPESSSDTVKEKSSLKNQVSTRRSRKENGSNGNGSKNQSRSRYHLGSETQIESRLVTLNAPNRNLNDFGDEMIELPPDSEEEDVDEENSSVDIGVDFEMEMIGETNWKGLGSQQEEFEKFIQVPPQLRTHTGEVEAENEDGWIKRDKTVDRPLFSNWEIVEGRNCIKLDDRGFKLSFQAHEVRKSFFDFG
jgi:hypothetical protein